jgi:glycosyltransferase involved in cell wall biosynthesis
LEDIPSSYLASRAVRIPFIAYYFDWYGYQWPTRPARALALWFESMMIENSSAVVVPNEALRDALEKRYGVRAVVIYNPCDERALAVPPVLEWPIGQDEVRIVYTGAVYHAHYDAFRNLATALRDPLLSRARLHIYSSQPPAVLDSQGIEGPVAFHPHLVLDDMLAVQRRADILFLPLAFESTIDEVVRTSAPGKLGEYLASGRPILVHAPPDSFVSQYFRMHRCGVVVDTNSPGDLADGIRWIMEDQEMRRSIVRNAVERARQDFSPRKAREMFEQVLQGADQG